MKNKNLILRVLVSAVTILVLAFGMAGTGAASPQKSAAPRPGGVRVGYHPVTGMLAFIGAESSAPIGVNGAVGADLPAETRAEAILAAYAPQFGVERPESDLILTRTSNENGRQTVRYQQVYNGVPVMGGELVLNMNESGLVSMNGEASPALNIPTEPAISAEQARATARGLVAKHYELQASDLTVSDAALWIYDERLLTDSALLPPHIVWRVEVSAEGLPLRELVLVNALRGNISLNFNQVDTIWGAGVRPGSRVSAKPSQPQASQPAPQSVLGTPTLSTYNSGGTSGQQVTPICLNSHSRACSTGDAANAHGFAYDTYMRYAQAPFNRDSIDGAGMTLISNINWYSAGECPNAFWDGDEMTYCAGLTADDVVGHELTHGVTERESNLFYFWESGAINESLSDVWGEYVDQDNGYGNDAAAMKWKMGEDTAPIMGIIRDMKNPPLYGQPDSMVSAKYCKTGNCYSYDNGGVHTNSGVNNKAAYLMVDGGSFNGKTVTALGWTKTLVVYYEAQTNLLTSGSGYYDLYNALYQACLNKIGTSGLTLADCQEVRDATDAVKMSAEPAVGFNPNTGACPAGYAPYSTLLNEGFEGGTTGWTFGGTPSWTLWSNSFWPFNGWGPYAHSGVDSLYGDDYYTNNHTYVVSPSVYVPVGENTYLYFAHAYGFEYFGSSYYDGGVLEYSTDGGSTWINASALYSGGQTMKGTISNAWGNPLGGKKAFVSDSHGYVDSRFNLTSLAGQTVKFRWSLGTDIGDYYWGWVIDDVQVNTCLGIPSMPTPLAPASNALVTNYTPALDWSDSTGDVDHYRFQLDDNSDFSSPIYDSWPLYFSSVTLGAPLTPNTKYYWRVRAENQANGASAWSATRYFRTALQPPVTLTPGGGYPIPGTADPALTRRPTFQWTVSPGAASYTLEVSLVPNFATKALTKMVTGTSYTHTSDLQAAKIYYWRVRANGVNGPSAYSDIRIFLTGNPPSIPILTAPLNGALLYDTSPYLDWSPSTIPAGGAPFGYYEIQVDDNPTFDSLTYNVGVLGDSWTLPSLPSGTTYYWRIRAFNTSSEYSAWSVVRNFRVAYDPPILISPASGSTGLPLKPTLMWNPVPGATSYTLQISTSSGFSPLVVNKTQTGVVYVQPTNLLPNTTYYWRVRANGAYGPSLWQSFSFMTAP